MMPKFFPISLTISFLQILSEVGLFSELPAILQNGLANQSLNRVIRKNAALDKSARLDTLNNVSCALFEPYDTLLL